MQINKNNSKPSFKALYAPKEVQVLPAFKEAVPYLKTKAQKNDIFVQFMTENDENKTKKFLVTAKNFAGDLAGKAKTRLHTEGLKKAVDAAEKNLEKEKILKLANQMKEDTDNLFGDIFGAFRDFKPPSKPPKN